LNVSPSSIGTISLPPPTTAAALESIRQVRQNPEIVQRLQENTRYLRSRLIEHDFDVIGETNVLPVLLPPDLDPKVFARKLITDHGIWVSPIWFIAKPRIRITANSLHTKEEIDLLVSSMTAVRNEIYSSKPATISA
jgi:glycine C-acetyltransferase